MKAAKAILVISALLLLVSCKTRTQVEYRDRDVTKYLTQYVHDTLVVNTSDSVHESMLQHGDTIFVTKYKEVTKWRDRIVERRDTCFRDSIETQYIEKTKEVRYVPKIYKASMLVCVVLLIGIIVKLALWLKSKSII